MSNILKIWLFSCIFTCGALLVIAFFDGQLAGGLVWTFFHSESAISFWIAKGFGVKTATLIATGISTVAVGNWWLLANQDLKSVPSLQKFLEKFWDFSPTKINAQGLPSKLPYLFLPFASFVPDGGVWFSLAFSKFFRLKKWISFLLINVGNIAKNIVWGKFLSLLTEDIQIVAGVMLLGAVLVLTLYKRKKRKFPSE